MILDQAAILMDSGEELGDAAVNAFLHPYDGLHVVVVKERPSKLDPPITPYPLERSWMYVTHALMTRLSA